MKKKKKRNEISLAKTHTLTVNSVFIYSFGCNCIAPDIVGKIRMVRCFKENGRTIGRINGGRGEETRYSIDNLLEVRG